MKSLLKKLFGETIRKEESAQLSEYTPLDREQYQAYNKFRPEGAQKLFCYVPFTNMTFSFRGKVLACAYNQKVELGKYPEQSIKKMWFDSTMGNKLRDNMEHNDLSYGCKHCKYFFDNSKFSGLKPLVFDKYADYKKHKYPRVLEFELSNTCNFECIMCNGEVSSSIRKNRDKLPAIKIPYDDAFVEQLKEFIPHIKEAKFYGGEPFLIPIYYKIWDLIIKLNPKVRIFVITNGSVLNSKVKTMLAKGNFDIGVSMDSIKKKVIESIRINVQQEKLLKNIAYFHNYSKERNNYLTISFTMMRVNWLEFTEVITFCNERKIQLYVSYLKTPPQYALWNLPAEELRSIRLSLETTSFPKGNYVEKNNAKCFEDFLTYLSNCEKDNLEIPKEEEAPVVITSSKESKTHPNYNAQIDYEAISNEQFALYFDKDSIKLNDRERFYEKLKSTINELPSDKEINKIYFFISLTPTKVVFNDVLEKDVDVLKANMLQHC